MEVIVIDSYDMQTNKTEINKCVVVMVVSVFIMKFESDIVICWKHYKNRNYQMFFARDQII